MRLSCSLEHQREASIIIIVERMSFWHLPEIFDAKYEEVMQALDPEMDSFDKLMTLCFSVHDLIESDIPVGLLASLYSSQVVTKGDKHLLNQNRFYYKMVNR